MHLPRTVLTIALAATTASALPSFRSKQPTNDDVKCDGTTCPRNGRYEQPGGRQEKRSERGGGGKVSSPWRDDEGYPKSDRLVGDRERPNELSSGEREGPFVATGGKERPQTLVTGDENTRPVKGQFDFSSRGGKGGAPLTVARSYPSRNSGGEFGDVVSPQQGDKGGARADLVKEPLRGNPDDFRSVNPDDFHSGGLQEGKTNPDDFRSVNPDDFHSGTWGGKTTLNDFTGGKGGSPLLVPRNFHNRGPKQRMESERRGGAPLDVNGHFHSHGLNDFEAQPVHNHLQTRQQQSGPTSDFQPGQTEENGWAHSPDRLYVGNSHGHGNTQDFVGGKSGLGNTQDWVGQSRGHGNTQDFVGGSNGLGNTQDLVGGKSGLGNTQDFVGGKNGLGNTQDWVGQSRGHGNTLDFVGGQNGDVVTKQDRVLPGSSPLQTRQNTLSDGKNTPFFGPNDLTKRPECIEMASNPGFHGVNGDLAC